MTTREINSIVLAYIGDCVYENYIRHHLVSLGIANVNDLQKAAIKYVSATSQAGFVKMMIEENFLSEEEIVILNRARNNKSHSKPKSCDAITYKYATGLEALIGYLDLEGQKIRIDEIMNYIINKVI